MDDGRSDPLEPPRTVTERGELPATQILQGSLQPGSRPEQAGPSASPSPTLPAPGALVPGYTLEAELGRGGMGVVYRARQLGLNRTVALKMIVAGGHAGTDALVRFRREAEAVARLSHPGIVQVYDVGEHDGLPYFALEYCAGGSMADRLSGRPLPAREAVALLLPVARAVHAAHEAGVVHRDLKPANILLAQRQGAGPEAGTQLEPKVADFGLAKLVEGGDPAGQEKALTRTGDVMGTPSYMAPEQASGDVGSIGPATDVYALGAILYECLTGRPPFLAATTVDTVMRVLQHEPPPPRIFNHQVDADLERVVLKCLEKQPGLRYSSAAELARDLERYLAGEPVTARSVNLLERLQRELGHSQHDTHLRPWGFGLMLLAAGMLISHFATSVMLVAEVPRTIAYWVPRCLLLGTLVPVGLRYRPHQGLMPTNAVERALWALWLGYFLAFLSLFWVMRVQGHDRLEVYGVVTAVAGMAWFSMGGQVWGGCYLVGLGFLLAAPVLALMAGSPWSPFCFGALWSVALFVVGGRYYLRGRPTP